ncbi:unnamed protein product [Rhizopus stolonifer]
MTTQKEIMTSLELCIHDLVYPTEKSEALLETLIEEAVNKIKSKKIREEKEQLQPNVSELKTEIKEGIEWVSFVYSQHRTLHNYCIRTDLDQIDIDTLDEKFKKENCVYPRANLSREVYQGNRWNYETECNILGWKLAHLNSKQLAGKRGLIQRAVDSYRNRYPNMRSRRVARQEKLLKGTLRKRKQETSNIPKTILIEENGIKYRIRINIESVSSDSIDLEFKKTNCVFPRAMLSTLNLNQRRLDEIRCNEIGWKLAWLNPRMLANKKNMLQRALDTYRYQFTPDLKPRKYAPRISFLQAQKEEESSLVNTDESISYQNTPTPEEALLRLTELCQQAFLTSGLF